MWRRRALGLGLLLAGCDHLVVIDAVEGPDGQGAPEGPDTEDGEDDSADGPADAPETRDADGGVMENTPLDERALDAGTPEDASADAARGRLDASADAALAACGGKRVLDLCWYLGKEGASCDRTCRDKGGFDARALRRVGSGAQGGSLRACTQVLTALGHDGDVIRGFRGDDVRLGCHLWNGRDGWWLDGPDFSSAASTSVATIACACLR